MKPPNRENGKSSVTMHDVARLARVSQSTVSRVLNNSYQGIPISEETRERVMNAIRELGYYPNLHAGSLRGQKTKMLAVMIADISNPFYHPMVRAVQDVARSHKYDVIVSNTDHVAEVEYHFLESIIRRPVDGVLLVPYHLTNSDIDQLIQRGCSAVAAVGQHVNHPLVDVAFGSDDRAIFEAVSWLIQRGPHRRIAYIGVTRGHQTGERRYQAVLAALRAAGLHVPQDYFQEGDWSPASGDQAMRTLLALPEPPTAVFVANDLMAMGAMEAARQWGIRVPEDLAVVGFDDIPVASWVRPRLTTVAQYPEEMGDTLVRALFERIDGEYEGAGRRYEIPCRLVIRDSA